nr:immunoglobulin heavy chain junction region [Macaca mulatta]MOV37962.1 immunoglobulin heavy chain junction region [Macaca mulatta]MOV38087.1 immunoglobulin heavy chain junction region [Macaca mulatta]MOV38099.1 immunoglobulin heavy chain junction region [Macaca mulatta]MOV38160.1 immunoglobulin heavy chain junction region [Macaca mulatta]
CSQTTPPYYYGRGYYTGSLDVW